MSKMDFSPLSDTKSGSPQSRTCLPASVPTAGGAGRPSGRRPKPLDGYGAYYEACIERTETFLFGGISRQTKKAFSASSAPLR